jgi:hypothetical protein
MYVRQDVRGRYGSEGIFQHMTPHIDDKKSDTDVDESSDTYDTIEWLVNNIPNNNGRVGIMVSGQRGSSSVWFRPRFHRCGLPCHVRFPRREFRTQDFTRQRE